jgi:LPS export ABC transporter protein LptC
LFWCRVSHCQLPFYVPFRKMRQASRNVPTGFATGSQGCAPHFSARFAGCVAHAPSVVLLRRAVRMGAERFKGWMRPGAGLALAALALLGTGCSTPDAPSVATEGKRLPLTEYRDSTILDMHDGSRLSWRLKTTHLVRWPGSELVHATPVHLTVYDSSGQFLMRVTADSGAVDEAVNFLLARGNVHGVSAKGMELTTDSLRWSKSLNQVTTEARVRVVSENGDVLTGRGFVSDANLDHWQILSEVQGVFQQAGERAEGL